MLITGYLRFYYKVDILTILNKLNSRLKFKWLFTPFVSLFMQFSFPQENATGIIFNANRVISGSKIIIPRSKNGVQTDAYTLLSLSTLKLWEK